MLGKHRTYDFGECLQQFERNDPYFIVKSGPFFLPQWFQSSDFFLNSTKMGLNAWLVKTYGLIMC